MSIDAFLTKYYAILNEDIESATQLICNNTFSSLEEFERIRGRLNGIKLAKYWLEDLYKKTTEPESATIEGDEVKNVPKPSKY